MKKRVRRLFSVVAIALVLTCQSVFITLTTVIGAPLPAAAAQDYSQQKSQSYTPSKRQKDHSQTQSSSGYGKQQSKQTNTQQKQYTQKDQSSQSQ
ncbi:MAG: hypothetical protein AAF572_16020 [Cyanobacteria bacterium P01_B01_bin.77]